MKLMTAMRLVKRKSDNSFHPYIHYAASADLGAHTVSSKTAKTLLPTGLPPTLPLSHPSARALATFPNVARTTWARALATISPVRIAA